MAAGLPWASQATMWAGAKTSSVTMAAAPRRPAWSPKGEKEICRSRVARGSEHR